jgi:hypothetical protein
LFGKKEKNIPWIAKYTGALPKYAGDHLGEMYDQAKTMLEEAAGEKLKVFAQQGEDVQAAVRKASEKTRKSDVDRAAIMQAWAQQNRGQRVMEYGGPNTQKLYDQFAAAPQNSDPKFIDKCTCSFCGKSGTEKVLLCARCRKKYYCSKECQRVAWKSHKRLECVFAKSIPFLTWEQVEAHGGSPVVGKVLQVRAMMDESMMRQVVQCKDRAGVVHRIAASPTVDAFQACNHSWFCSGKTRDFITLQMAVLVHELKKKIWWMSRYQTRGHLAGCIWLTDFFPSNLKLV